MRMVVLTGAGVSAESGLGTFRDKGGIWARYDLSEVATPEGFARDPGRVHDFYNLRRAQAAESRPNTAHAALARLAQAMDGDLLFVTQNVDDLHDRAGTPGVLHMHGRLDTALCAACGARWTAPARMTPRDPCPTCSAHATRSDVVWFGEMPHGLDRIAGALEAADLFVAIGTSGSVYPAAGFAAGAQDAGARTLELNLAPSDAPGIDGGRYGPATVVVPAWVDEILGTTGGF
ncbi:NAD-dependent deacylase [Mesobaculum littorinae]